MGIQCTIKCQTHFFTFNPNMLFHHSSVLYHHRFNISQRAQIQLGCHFPGKQLFRHCTSTDRRLCIHSPNVQVLVRTHTTQRQGSYLNISQLASHPLLVLWTHFTSLIKIDHIYISLNNQRPIYPAFVSQHMCTTVRSKHSRIQSTSHYSPMSETAWRGACCISHFLGCWVRVRVSFNTQKG